MKQMCVETRVKVSGNRPVALEVMWYTSGSVGVAGGMSARDGRECLLGVKTGNYGL